MHHTLILVRKAPCQHFPGGFPLIGSCCKEVSSVVIKTGYSQKLTLLQGFSLCAPHVWTSTLSTPHILRCRHQFHSAQLKIPLWPTTVIIVSWALPTRHPASNGYTRKIWQSPGARIDRTKSYSQWVHIACRGHLPLTGYGIWWVRHDAAGYNWRASSCSSKWSY